MKHLVFFIFFLSPLVSFAQLSVEVSKHYDAFKSYTIEQNPDSIVMDRDTYRQFMKICNAATDEELLHIETDAGTVVREYLVKELVERKAKGLDRLFSKYVYDNNVIRIESGDQLVDWSLAIELYEAVAYQKVKLERRKYYEKTTSKGLLTDVKQLFGPEYETRWSASEVDSLLQKFDSVAFATDDIAPQLLNYIYRHKEFKVGHYDRVRYFATKYPTAEVLATLANFKNPKDVPFLKENIDNAFLAIAKYPHPSFLPELKNRLNMHFDNAEFQEAVSSYSNPDSRSLLDAICKKIAGTYSDDALRNEKLFSLYSIMERHNYTYYRPVLAKIDSMLN